MESDAFNFLAAYALYVLYPKRPQESDHDRFVTEILDLIYVYSL